MRGGGLEPPQVSLPDPKSGASANSAILAAYPVYDRAESLLKYVIRGRGFHQASK